MCIGFQFDFEGFDNRNRYRPTKLTPLFTICSRSLVILHGLLHLERKKIVKHGAISLTSAMAPIHGLERYWSALITMPCCSIMALWHAGFQPSEQSFLCINQINSRCWQVGKPPTELHKQHDLSTFSLAFFMKVYVKLVNHPVQEVKLVIYQLANCVNSFC